MEPPTKKVFKILLIALALGVAGDALLRSTPWGINIFLWIGLLVMAVLSIAPWKEQGYGPKEIIFVLPALLFAGGFAGRDSAVLRGLNAGGLFVSLMLVIGRSSGSVLHDGLGRYARQAMDMLGNFLTGFPHLLCRDAEWPAVSDPQVRRQAAAITTGVVVSIPLLLGFGGLLVAADAVYKKILSDLIELDLPDVFTHATVMAGCAWLAGGYLRASVFNRNRPPLIATDSGGMPWLIEINVVLVLLNVLFLSFVAVQFQYLFGGAAHVEVTPGITYAEYARHGFFELVAVAAAVLPLLLGADWFLRGEKDKRLFRILSGMLILLLFIIMASAFQRMRLYQAEYGWTELRFYVTAFMTWLAMLFLWFVLTISRGKRENFAFGALITGFVLVVGMNLLNPDDFIVRSNLIRSKEGRSFDARYAVSLSSDAVPALKQAVSDLAAPDQEIVRRGLSRKVSIIGTNDWRSWNYSRATASRILRKDE